METSYEKQSYKMLFKIFRDISVIFSRLYHFFIGLNIDKSSFRGVNLHHAAHVTTHFISLYPLIYFQQNHGLILNFVFVIEI